MYRLRPTAPAYVADVLNAGGSAMIEPVKNAFTEGAAMTAVCLMDALCDFEHSAGYRRGVKDAGGDPDALGKGDPRGGELGDLISETRSECGSFEVRQMVLDMVSAVDRAWDRVNADDACDGTVCFDFEFCPAAIRLRFEKGLVGVQLEDALTDLGRDMVEEAEKWFAEQRAERDRGAAVRNAQNALAQAQASVEAAARHLQSLTA